MEFALPMLDLPVLAACFVIVLIAGLVQGITGFGSALVMVPTMVLLVEPKVVIPLALVHGTVLNSALLMNTRRSVEAKKMAPLLIAGVLGIPFGTLLLLLLDPEPLKVFAGAVIMIFSILLLAGLSLELKRERLAMWITGILSGILNGALSMSGPPVILLFTNQRMRKERFRANLVFYFLMLNIVTILIFLAAGLFTWEVLEDSAVLLPGLAIGLVSGIYLSRKVAESPFRKLALLLVLATGMVAVISGIASLF